MIGAVLFLRGVGVRCRNLLQTLSSHQRRLGKIRRRLDLATQILALLVNGRNYWPDSDPQID
jgi:hypothetical protein